jgi:hypothetical protein
VQARVQEGPPLSDTAPSSDLPKSKELASRLRLSASRQASLQSSLRYPITSVLRVEKCIAAVACMRFCSGGQ